MTNACTSRHAFCEPSQKRGYSNSRPFLCLAAGGRDKYGCYFFNERRAIELTLILGVIPTVFVMCKLMKGHDVFDIGPEIVNVMVPIMIGGGTS